MILCQLIFNHRDLHGLEVLFCSQPVYLLGHGQRLRRDNYEIKVLIDGWAALIDDLGDAGFINVKASLYGCSEVLRPDIEIAHWPVPGCPCHLVRGEANYDLSLSAKLKGTLEKLNMPVMNGIECASYSNSGHTGPEMRVRYKYLAAATGIYGLLPRKRSNILATMRLELQSGQGSCSTMRTILHFRPR